MDHTHKIVKSPASVNVTQPQEPKEVRITLSVCSCRRNEKVIFVTAKAERIAMILGITGVDLECTAVTAMFSGKPQVVACYKNRDFAESKLSQLKALTPFIARSRHSFQLVDEE